MNKLNRKNKVIIISLVIFTASFLLSAFLHTKFLLYVSGFFVALYIPGFAIKNILDPTKGLLSNLITAPVFTIFFFIPVFFGITKILDGRMHIAIATALLVGLALLSILKTHNNSDAGEKKNNGKKYILFGAGVFIIVHTLTTLAYRFIPEVDGYTDLMNVERIVSSGIFDISYRPLFSLLMSYISLVSQIPPYWLFKFAMILIQMSGVYYLYQIIKVAGIKSAPIKYLILLSLSSVPVINLEIDGIRPNVIFIFALLPFIYYLSRGIDGLKRNFILSSVIATTGLMYHEFFGILFLINVFFLTHYFYKKLNNINKLFSLLVAAIAFFIVLVNIHRFSILPYFLHSLQQFIQLISDGIHWKWWFLDNYVNLGGSNLGWVGFQDVSKYYAYSISPFLVFILVGSIVLTIRKIKRNDKVYSMEKVAFSILFVGLLFSELLPRIDFKTLPDRFWPMTSMCLIVLTPFVFSMNMFIRNKVAFIIVLVLLATGIGGTVYIAKAKGGYTSEKEYTAAQWIKRNTPNNSLFITQGENGVVLRYFAKREHIIVPGSSFFINNDTQRADADIPVSEDIHKVIIALLVESLKKPNDYLLNSLTSNIKKYHDAIKKEQLLDKLSRPEFVPPENESIFVLYSLDKFNNYYGQRQWWRDANFYGADLSKFNEGYDLVYNDSNIIYIWKRK